MEKIEQKTVDPCILFAWLVLSFQAKEKAPPIGSAFSKRVRKKPYIMP